MRKLILAFVLSSLFISCSQALKKESTSLKKYDQKISKQADRIRKLERENKLLKAKRIQAKKKSSTQQKTKKLSIDDKELYKKFMQFANRGDQNSAVRVLKIMDKAYPKSTHTAEAFYKASRMSIQQGKYKTALKYINHILQNFKSHKRYISAMLAKGIVYEEMKLKTTAKKIYKSIKNKYPNTPQSFRADLQLKSLEDSRVK